MKNKMKVERFFKNGISITEEYAKDLEIMREVELEIIREELKKYGIGKSINQL